MKYDNENWKGTSIYDFINFNNKHKSEKIDIDLDKIIYDNWTVGAIINEITQSVEVIMNGNGWVSKFKTLIDFTIWLKREYPDVGVTFEVLRYFAVKYKLINRK